MSLEKEKILEFNQYMKSDKMQFIIYADIESLIKKKRWMCKQFNSVTTKLRQHIPCEYSVSTIQAFDHTENILLYRGKDFVKTFCASVREHTKYIIDFEKKKSLM